MSHYRHGNLTTFFFDKDLKIFYKGRLVCKIFSLETRSLYSDIITPVATTLLELTV